jgi:hypothetical protein
MKQMAKPRKQRRWVEPFSTGRTAAQRGRGRRGKRTEFAEASGGLSRRRNRRIDAWMKPLTPR